MLPFNNSKMEFESLLSNIKNANDACSSLIGEDQRQQIHDLEITNNSLNNMIKIKDDNIQQLQNYIGTIESKITSIIEYLRRQNNTDEKLQDLQEIEVENDIPSKIDLLFQFTLNTNQQPSTSQSPKQKSKLYQEEQTQNSRTFTQKLEEEANEELARQQESINRLRKQLQGHAEFLTRLVQAPEYQNFFLISNQTGKTFLDTATKNLILEQARRTTELIYSLQQEGSYSDSLATIDDILGHKVDLNQRTRILSKYLSRNNCSLEDIQDMLLQETVITSFLAKAYDKMRDKAENLETKVKTYQNTRSPQYLPSSKVQDREILRSSPDADKLFDRQGKTVINLINKALGEKEEYSKQQLLDSSLRMAQDYLNAQKLAGTNVSFSDYVTQTGESIQTLMKKVKEMKENMKNYQRNQRSTTQQNYQNEDSWQNWARRVYAGILGIEARPKNDKDMQIIIEESALTSCGNRQLQRRLESLRNQKKVMTEPNVTSNGRVHFKTLLAVSITVMRMRRAASFRTPSYFRVSPFQ